MSDENQKKYTYFITGGGTGGHIYPAIAIADALLKDSSTQDIYYIGNPKNLEFEISKQKGYKFLDINIQGMPREFGLKCIKWLINLMIASIKCKFYISKYKPDAIIGTGGYVSAPPLLAAMMFARGGKHRVPFMLHDCDAMPGLVTRKFSSDAAAVSLAFEVAKDYIKNKNIFVNGNPIRDKFKTLSKENARENLGLKNKLTLCVMGGSQGARTINDATVELLKFLSQEKDMQIIFQTGKKNFERVIEQLIRIYPNYESDKNLIVRPYFDDMVSVLKASDIAVSRAGSLSLSEICASGLASILIPYPHAASDHQRKNAKYMVDTGAALYIEDSEITKQSLKQAVLSLTDDEDKLKNLQENALKLAKFDGTEKIISQLKQIADGELK